MAVLRRSSRMPPSRRAAHAIWQVWCTPSVPGSGFPGTPPSCFSSPCGFTRAQQSMVGHILLFFRSPDNVLLRSSSVELVLRLGLNSHSLHPEGFPSTAQFAFRLAGDPEHATIVSSAALCCRCLPSYSWYLSAFVVAGAEVGGWAPKLVVSVPAALSMRTIGEDSCSQSPRR